MHALPRRTHLSRPYRFLCHSTILPLFPALLSKYPAVSLSRCHLTVILPDPCTSRMSSTHRGFLTEASPLSVCLSNSVSRSLSSSLSIYLPRVFQSFKSLFIACRGILFLPPIVPSASGLSDLLGVPLLSISSRRNLEQLVWGRLPLLLQSAWKHALPISVGGM